MLKKDFITGQDIPFWYVMYPNIQQNKYFKESNPRVGLIALASDFIIEKDFVSVLKDKNVDFFVSHATTKTIRERIRAHICTYLHYSPHFEATSLT